ncbi:apolipoprotein B-100-like [Parambassis ranga]|uniref:Apolipoprotein B-100-like n=1 Tax=Parambassis ranga TaxID=210632 RepID=A0A6P7HU28_9TELE|nr:apolipoprotein B-100-like [Parambassis ranga]XP_028254056.1 apolipoprotein B-100-like [Parambassis ranga]XP_028254057.1 apolipoprotein B-100-like [Parambassis ranga]XP_028254058.1 apolipoprotein B-100-like [Parambassis ranga]
MGDSKLCLLLLLSTSALAFAQDDDQPSCLLAQRYKTLHKYEYKYEAESLNAINGASQLKNGPKATCTVEIEVPQTCSFIVRTTGCTLSEVVDMDADGNSVFGPAPSSDAFAAEMERYPLKVVVEGVYNVKLYPEDGETTTILNIKRGIISALAVPLLEEDKNKNMPTIHGKCRTYYSVNAREDIATDISLTRDLSRCDKFVPMRDHTSPLALITGMHYPLAQLIRSTQTCNYKFDNEKKHMTSGSCTENHILIPFSHKGEYGVTNIGKQELTLVQVSPHNDRVFDTSDIVKDLYMEAVEDKSVVQDKDAALSLLRELDALPETEGEKRAHLFHKLVSMVRGMKTETLTPAIPEALAVSRVLTYQVLAQCGTPECSSAIMQILRTFESTGLEVDATVFAMGLMSNPSALLINDMLQMAKYKSSKPIMYALSNVVKRFYKVEGKIIPEILSVAEFMAAQLGDCSGDNDNTFMTLRVVGNMAPAVIPFSPALRAAVIQCVNQPAASLAVQQSAIQVFRLTPVPEEGREVLMQVLLNNASPTQKRIAAYLVLMKDPQPSELTQLANALPNEQDQQVKSFIISHMTNILSTTGPETQELRQKILDAIQGNEIGPIMDPTKFSRNYKIGSLEGNMIFEGASYLPKEVMLEMTLKAFGFHIDMMEVGMEGKGFEPTVDALFGENGFFPDTVMKTMYFVSDNLPTTVNEILQNIVPDLKRNRMKRQTSQNLMREVGRNLNKLVRDLKSAESPEAMVYLRLLGNELGYLKTNEMDEMAYSAAMMFDSMFKMFPSDLIKALMTETDNTLFAHYIFMDNEFFLPTVTGVPLRIALSGTFTPGIKGGLKMARDMSEVSFMPSAGIEFVTQIGSHIPEYVNSGLEMHTNIFHESRLRAKISIERDNVKLTIPALTSPTKLIKMTNTLVAVTGSEVKAIPPMLMDRVDVTECTPVFAGMKYCTGLQYTDAFFQETAPYFPFTGNSQFFVELHPTGEVAEYTATLAYELLKEGDEGRQKVDSVKFVLKADGAEPTEARAVLKYNRRKNIITADIQIPDYDVEAGLRLGVIDGSTKGKGTHSISLDFINKNIPQLSLVGRANMKDMKEGMLQVQLLVPAISADATVTANMKREEKLELELKSEIKVMDATSEQTIGMKYDGSKIEMDVKSDLNTKTASWPNADFIEKYGNELLDMQVGQTDMKARHIFKKFVEAANNYMDKYGDDLPYIQNFRMPDIPEISLPETLFLNIEANTIYRFNNERFTITIPLPLGGKSTEELNFPPVLTTPSFSMPQFGLEIVSMEIPIPELFVPESFTLSVPLFGKAEVSSQMRSNLYDMDASISAGKDLEESSSYSAKVLVKGTSPVDVLSFGIEGSGLLANTDSIKANLKSSFSHKFMDASISIVEDATITDKINLKSSSKIEATSPFGLKVVLEHTSMTGINTEEMSADSNFEGMFQAGPIYGKTMSTQSFIIFPFRPEAKIDSTVQFDSTIIKAKNVISASLANGEFSVESRTNAFEDAFTHVGEVSFKDSKLSLKCDANAFALGMKIRNQAEASAGSSEVIMRMETNADHSENRVYSLLTASLDVNGLDVNSNANVKFLENEAIHKATLRMSRDGLTTSGTTTLQSPLSYENTFNAGLDATRATLSITNKAAMHDIKVDNGNTLTITLSSLDFNSKAEAIASEYASYTHDITFDLKPYTASANVKNNLKLLAADFINEAQLQAELYKIDLTGSLKAVYGEEEIKHTYQITYADMSANAKCSTTGKLFGSHMSHNTELEVIGLAAKFSNDARFNSQPMRFDHTIRCSIVPFDFNLDAIFNGDGDMTLYGKHSAQLYGKLLLRAQPLAFASSHEYRASVTQQLNNGFALETIFDNKMDTVLSLQEQKSSYKMKSKMNDHVFNQDIEVYNTDERTGIEVSGTVLTNIINTASTDNQEFTISGFLKYDKNTDSHIIQFPLIENLPVFLESIKGFIVRVAETLQDFINNEEIRAKLEALPQLISDFVAQMKIEERATQLKQYFSDFTQKYAISMDDVEASLTNLKVTVERLLADLTVYIQNLIGSSFPETFVQKIIDLMTAINEEYDIKGMFMYVIDTIRQMVHQIDLENLKGSSIAFLQDIDAKYEIKAEVLTFIGDIRLLIETFDLERFVAEVKNFIKVYIEELVSKIPTETLNNIIAYIRENIQDFDILGKINTFYAKMRELIVKFEADQKVQAVFEKALELLKKWKIEETITAAIKMVKDADIPAKFMQFFQRAINYLKTTEVKDIIQQLNMYIETTVQKLNSLDYNDFVNQFNQIIAEYTVYLNEIIKTLEIPQKYEAVQDFVNMVFSSVRDFMKSIRETRVTEMVKTFLDMIDQVVFNNLKSFAETAKEKMTNFDIKAEISFYVDYLCNCYREAITITTDFFTVVVATLKNVLPDQKIISEIQQIIDGLFTELRNAEIDMPSFIIPLTDLEVPTMKFSIAKLEQFEIPTQLDIPEFTILSRYNIKAFTISIDDIKQRIIELIEFIVNFDVKMLNVDAFFGDLTLNYLPSMPEITFPEITLPEISFPTIPQVPVEKLVKSLQVPEFKLPTIPSDIMVPCFGKLYGEIRFHSPIYAIKTSAEFQNSTENALTPQFTGFFTSQGTSPSYEALNYKLDTTARIAIPKMSRIVLAETVKFNHVALELEHQASLTFYGLSAQAQTKSAVKVNTAPYTASLMNIAFIGMEGGMSGSLDTTYSHVVDLPIASITSEAKVTQKTIVRLDGLTFTVSAENSGSGKFNAENGNHNSKFHFSLTPSIATLTFSGDTDSTMLKMKQQIDGEFGTFSYFKFNVRNEAEAPIVKNSLLVASGLGSLYELKVELKANHDTELYGAVSGVLSNAININARPMEVVFEFQNKGNGKINLFKSLTAKIDLQNDYTANINTDSQHMNAILLTRLNQYKMLYNLTLDNNLDEAGIYVAMESEASLDFLKYPISIPEIDLPFVAFHTPAVSDFNLYEQTGLQNILTTTEQSVDVDTKIVYKKSQAAPLVDMMGLIQIPSVGNLITEMSFKSAFINLNVNAGLYTEDDLVFRLGATTASVYESLRAKLDGTTSLTTKRGIKLANSLSLQNLHVEATHDSTISMSTETLESAVSVATVAKIALPVLNLQANQNLLADTKTKPNVQSTFRVKGDVNIPMIKAVGKAEAEHSLKLEGTFEDVSMESSLKGNMDGAVFEDYLLLGILDNEANMYLNSDGLRSTCKVIADAKLNNGATKVIAMDVNENLAVEASMSRVYAVLKYTGNNEANLFDFTTKGKHVAQATIDFAPFSSLTADVEIDISQPNSLGDLTYFERTTAEMTAAKQKISTNAKFVSPLYTTNMDVQMEGDAPELKAIFKSSATSPIVVLEYDMDASTTASFKNDALNIISKVVLTHADLTLDVNHVIGQVSRNKRQADDSAFQHRMSVNIVSPTFTNLALGYAAHSDSITATVSTQSGCFLAIRLSGLAPSQMNARVYARYPSAPEVDVDILDIRSSLKDADSINLQVAYNMEAPKAMVSELKMKIPSILSSLKAFADRYQITSRIEMLTDSASRLLSEAYNVAVNYDAQMSQLSVLFRNTIVQYQKTVQAFLDAVIKFLQETQFKLPGSNEMATLPEVLKKLTSSVAAMLDTYIKMIYENMEVYYNTFIEQISSVKLQMPVGDAVTGGQIIDQVKAAYRQIFDWLVDFVKNMESVDTMLMKVDETLKAVVEKSREFVDSVDSDYLDAVLINVNDFYRSLVTFIKNEVDKLPVFSMEEFTRACESFMDMFIHVIDQFNSAVYGFLQQASEEAQAYMKV